MDNEWCTDNTADVSIRYPSLQQAHVLPALRETIQLQSFLLDIMSAFEPFSVLIEQADARHTPLSQENTAMLWQSVILPIQTMQQWAKTICYIGDAFSTDFDPKASSCSGEKWAVDIELMRRSFQELLIDEDRKNQSISQILQRSSWIRRTIYILGLDANRWNTLVELNRRYRHLLLSYIFAVQHQIQVISDSIAVSREAK